VSALKGPRARKGRANPDTAWIRKSGDRSEEASPWMWNRDSMTGSLLMGDARASFGEL